MRKKVLYLATTAIIFLQFNGFAQKPPPPKPPKAPVLVNEEFLKRNPSVKNIEWKNGTEATVIVVLKNGSSESYNLEADKDKNLFIAKYGILPPPPPPVAPTPPEVEKAPFVEPIEPVITLADFYKKNAGVKRVNWEGQIISLIFRDGSKKEYNLENNEDKEAFIKEYGGFPLPPPPPPPTAPAPPRKTRN